jgi:uncharacterized protein YtpQ (UPF0354 family)
MGFLSWFRRGRHAGRAPREAAVDGRKLFVSEVEALLRAKAGVTGIERHDDNLSITLKFDGETHTLFLENHLAETRDLAPEERRERIAKFIDSLFETAGEDEDDWETARDRLRLMLKPCSYGADLRGDAIVIMLRGRPVLPGLVEIAVVDMPSSVSFVGNALLETWSVPEDEVYSAARNNMARCEKPLALYDASHGPLLHAPGEDAYAASWLLAPGWLASLADSVEGRPIAIAPERSMIFVAGDARPEMVQRLAEMAQREYGAAQRSISPCVYTVDDAGSVVPCLRPGTDALACQLRVGHELLMAREYAEQKAILDGYHSAKGIDVFVATYVAMKNKAGMPYSYCTWTDAVAALLPRTRLVSVVAARGVVGSVLFEDALRIGGDMIVPAPMQFGPDRFEVRGEFSSAQLEAFRAAAVDVQRLD